MGKPKYTPTWTIYSPWVILSDFGGAFSMGAIGGGVWHGIKGARNSPRARLFSPLLLALCADQEPTIALV